MSDYESDSTAYSGMSDCESDYRYMSRVHHFDGRSMVPDFVSDATACSGMSDCESDATNHNR
jgi:hypothetical protein